MTPRTLAALVAASAGWGLAAVGVRVAFMEGTSTFTVVVVRTGLAVAAMVLFSASRRASIPAAAWRDGAIIGIPRIALAPMFFIASLNFISAGFESLLITLIPVTTAVLARFTLGEQIHRRQVIGMSLGLAGTLLLISSGNSGIADGSGNTVVGGALAMGGVLFGSISGVLSRRFSPRHGTAHLALPMFVTGFAVVATVGFVIGGIEFAGVTPVAWQVLVLLGLGSTLLPFVATLYASRHTTASIVALTGYAAPIIGVVAGAVLLDEVITPAIAVGGALAMAGVVLAGSARNRRVAALPAS